MGFFAMLNRLVENALLLYEFIPLFFLAGPHLRINQILIRYDVGEIDRFVERLARRK